MNLLFTCEQCGVAVDDDNIGCVENNWCDECMDKWCNEQVARWWPVFEVERRAGLTKSQEQINAELRDAGRGHLIGE